MTSASKKKGSAFEVRVRDYLRTAGFPHAERIPSEGAKDRGDIAGVPFVLECKATTREQLAEAMKEARKEALNAGKPGYAVVRPNRGKPIEEAFVTCPLWLFASLMREDAEVSASA
jgi:hypothetical protein